MHRMLCDHPRYYPQQGRSRGADEMFDLLNRAKGEPVLITDLLASVAKASEEKPGMSYRAGPYSYRMRLFFGAKLANVKIDNETVAWALTNHSDFEWQEEENRYRLTREAWARMLDEGVFFGKTAMIEPTDLIVSTPTPDTGDEVTYVPDPLAFLASLAQSEAALVPNDYIVTASDDAEPLVSGPITEASDDDLDAFLGRESEPTVDDVDNLVDYTMLTGGDADQNESVADNAPVRGKGGKFTKRAA